MVALATSINVTVAVALGMFCAQKSLSSGTVMFLTVVIAVAIWWPFIKFVIIPFLNS